MNYPQMARDSYIVLNLKVFFFVEHLKESPVNCPSISRNEFPVGSAHRLHAGIKINLMDILLVVHFQTVCANASCLLILPSLWPDPPHGSTKSNVAAHPGVGVDASGCFVWPILLLDDCKCFPEIFPTQQRTMSRTGQWQSI